MTRWLFLCFPLFAGCSSSSAAAVLTGAGLGMCGTGVANQIAQEMDRPSSRFDPSETYLGVSCGLGAGLMIAGGVIFAMDASDQREKAAEQEEARRRYQPLQPTGPDPREPQDEDDDRVRDPEPPKKEPSRTPVRPE